jgi:two-component system cell cycle response regulator
MDGYEVCRRIRRNPRTRELPILLATSGPGEMIYTLDADGFLAKPFHRDILLTFVSHVMQSRQRKSK